MTPPAADLADRAQASSAPAAQPARPVPLHALGTAFDCIRTRMLGGDVAGARAQLAALLEPRVLY